LLRLNGNDCTVEPANNPSFQTVEVIKDTGRKYVCTFSAVFPKLWPTAVVPKLWSTEMAYLLIKITFNIIPVFVFFLFVFLKQASYFLTAILFTRYLCQVWFAKLLIG